MTLFLCKQTVVQAAQANFNYRLFSFSAMRDFTTLCLKKVLTI